MRYERSLNFVKARFVLAVAAAIGPLIGFALVNTVVRGGGWARIALSFLMLPGVISWQIGSRVGTQRLAWAAVSATAVASVVAILIVLAVAASNGGL